MSPCHEIGHRQADEHIGIDQRLGQCAGLIALREFGFLREHLLLAAVIDQPGDVAHPDVLARHADGDEHVGGGDGGCARAREHHFDLIDRFAGDLQIRSAAPPSAMMAVPC